MRKSNGISTSKIAEICGVSQGTVDRALNNRKGIKEETKKRIVQVAKEYGYHPNIHARCIANGKSQLIGVVVFDLKNHFFTDMITNIEKICAEKGYSMVVMFTDKNSKTEIECIKNLYHISVDGIILCPINNGEEYEKFLTSLEIPVVTFGNKLNSFPYVSIDNAMAMRDVFTYVVEKGYKKLVYVKPKMAEKNAFAQKERLNAFIEMCASAKIEYAVTDFSNAENEMEDFCAVICPTDIYAIKLLSAAQKHKAGIIGFDNVHIIDELDLKLDSVACDVLLTAKTAVEYIISGAEIKRFVSHSIVKRGSI